MALESTTTFSNHQPPGWSHDWLLCGWSTQSPKIYRLKRETTPKWGLQMISKKKMFETWNQHLELDESVWDDLPNTQISSFTKKIQPKPRVLVAILGGGLAPNPPMKQLKYWNYWCTKNCIAPSLGGMLSHHPSLGRCFITSHPLRRLLGQA